ncbi:hypothetical protein M23134_05710 [Microscilla marina ATCC 23134]|uniref:Outer membrane efflux protein n=2 Tax=Microscilla marina TaxID=1027 RepID=A1ZIG9_MICM2|nr:hypothetical protein M23134_05710 [Microscilla marina ATCC 23134]
MIGVTSSGKSQTILQQHLQKLLFNHQGIKVIEIQQLAAQKQAGMVGYLPDPEVGLGIFALPVETRLGAQRFRFSVSQALPWKGTLKQQRVIAQKQAKVVATRIPVLQNRLIWQFKKSYYPLYMLRQDSLLYVKYLDILSVYQKLTRQKYETGKASMVDIIRVRTETRQINTQLQLLSLKCQEFTEALKGLLFLEGNQVIAVDDSLGSPKRLLINSPGIFVDSAYQSNPQFGVWESQAQLLESKHWMTQLMSKPTIKFGLDYINVSARSEVDIPQNGRDALMGRVGVKIPLNQKTYRVERQQIRIQQEELKLKASVLKNNLRSRFQQLLVSYELTQTQLRLYKQQITDVQEAIRIQSTTFASSGKGFEEVLRFQQQILKYELARNKVLLKQFMIKAEIEMLLGKTQ